MKISLLTDAPKHNLALMKMSTWHKLQGDEVRLNMPLWGSDTTYASVLFDWNRDKFIADLYGGPAFDGQIEMSCSGGFLNPKWEKEVNDSIPDYELFDIDFSLGYTYRFCGRRCSFCKVWKIEKDKTHHSIWEFHDPRFKKICLLNNNTFMDPRWKQTFEEIWDAKLTVIDENGFDIRLIDDEKADALHRTKWMKHHTHFAWDRMEDEKKIRQGLKILAQHNMANHKSIFYVLIGFDTTEEEDLHRCQVLRDSGVSPYIMPFVENGYTKRFKRFIDKRSYHNFKTISEAWRSFNGRFTDD